MRRTNWFWGLFFILCAILLITSQLGFLGGVTPLSLILTLFFVVMLGKSLVRLEAFGIVFSLAFLAIIYSDYIGLQNVSSWIILLAALFAATGLSMLVKPRPKYKSHGYRGYIDSRETVEDVDDNVIRCKTSFGADTKYLRSSNLEEALFECSFGSLKVFLDQAQISPNGAFIQIQASFGQVELYIPHDWKVVDEMTASLGDVSIYGKPTPGDGPLVTLTGGVQLGSVEIHYI